MTFDPIAKADHNWETTLRPLLDRLAQEHGAYPDLVPIVRYRTQDELERWCTDAPPTLADHRAMIQRTAEHLRLLGIQVVYRDATGPAAPESGQARAAAEKSGPYRLGVNMSGNDQKFPGQAATGWVTLNLGKSKVTGEGREHTRDPRHDD